MSQVVLCCQLGCDQICSLTSALNKNATGNGGVTWKAPSRIRSSGNQYVVVLSKEETINKSVWQKGHFTSVCVFSFLWSELLMRLGIKVITASH